MKDKKSYVQIRQVDLENPNRFIGEGLGAPEVEIRQSLEVQAQESADCIHCLRTNK